MSTQKKRGQLKLKDRQIIQTYLEMNLPIKDLVNKLGVSKQTIYREIQRNGIKKNITDSGLRCALNNRCIACYNSIKKVYEHCTQKCDRYIRETCSKLTRAPFVCNTCEKKNGCKYQKLYYIADKAQLQAEESLSISRRGIRISQEDFYSIDKTISPLIKENKQSLNHILSTHKEIDVPERTIRNWINNGYTEAKKIDLHRAVSFKPKKEYIHRITKPADVILNRSYADFREYTKSNPQLLVSQYDTVEGLKSDSKRLLTIHFPSIEFQFGILLDSNTSEEVNTKLKAIRNELGNDLARKIFPILLSDNGVEFTHLYDLEADDNGEALSRVFYTNPYCSGQKGSCERNHELIRYVLPKGTSFEFLTQEKVNLLFSHMNSYYRAKLNGVRPYDLALTILGKKFLDLIGITSIEPDKVNLSPTLLRTIKKDK